MPTGFVENAQGFAVRQPAGVPSTGRPMAPGLRKEHVADFDLTSCGIVKGSRRVRKLSTDSAVAIASAQLNPSCWLSPTRTPAKRSQHRNQPLLRTGRPWQAFRQPAIEGAR
jgi:hypothetical protein